MGVGFGGCGGCGFGLWFNRKIRPTQLWVELSWVVAILIDLFTKELISNDDYFFTKSLQIIYGLLYRGSEGKTPWEYMKEGKTSV